MQKVFYEVNHLDKRCYETFHLSEDLLMEQAAFSLCTFIQDKFKNEESVLIVAGSGNNGADGITLARMLYSSYDVRLYIPYALKSDLAKLQLARALALGIECTTYVSKCDVLVDCLFGSGLNREFDDISKTIIDKLNRLEAYKIACDVPSGINAKGQILSKAFEAQTTITMGALKASMFSDAAKDYVGEIKVSNLGIQRELYEGHTKMFLLDKEDLNLPLRKKKNSHKGSFGHASVLVGKKEGAGILCADAAFAFGAGLVSIINKNNVLLPYHIMQEDTLPSNTTALALGMGLGNYDKNELKKFLALNIKKVIDADMFYEEYLHEYLDEKVVLTPHAKEFVALLKILNLADISIKELQNNRIHYALVFSRAFPKTTLLLKGANTLIVQEEHLLINTYGSAALSKGGSGDVLAGLILALLAQGYSTFEAAYNASLSHSIAASNYSKNNYALSPQDLIDEVKCI